MTTVAVKERPLLMHGVEVRAVLDDRMSLFIRVMKPQPEQFYTAGCGIGRSGYPDEWTPTAVIVQERDWRAWAEKAIKSCPYGIGDRLWVKETWAVDAPLDQVRREREDVLAGIGNGPYYRADKVHENTGLTWRPSIFMPRWASRITLEVTGVRVALLQSISLEDMRAGGLRPNNEASLLWRETLAENFRMLWDSVNPKHPWSSNPWVRCVSVRRVN